VTCMALRRWVGRKLWTFDCKEWDHVRLHRLGKLCGRGWVGLRHFGQPVAQTHPHLVEEGELTPGITKAEYKERRQNLVDKISATRFFKENNDHVIIIPGANQKYMTKNIPYVFKQNTDLHYLTGFLEPDSCLVLLKYAGSSGFETLLFVPEVDETDLVWHGPSSGVDAAVDLFAADRGIRNRELKTFLDDFKAKSSRFSLWYDCIKPAHPDIHAVVNELMLESAHDSVHSYRPVIDSIKIIKSPAEVSLVKTACSIAARCLKDTIVFTQPGMRESILASKIGFSANLLGAERLSFPPVVASGVNANVIHYTRNDQIIKVGDLVLMDTGCEYHGYSSDLTRTWPVSGRFSPAQKVLYDIVLETQRACMGRLTPGERLDDLHRFMLLNLGLKMRDAGVLKSNVDIQNEEELIRIGQQCCPHHVSHYLGMDVHDSPTMSRKLPLEPMMVVTNEPGLYFPSYTEVSKLVHPEFVGLGIRIEDDVLIEAGDPNVLTAECPVDRDSMEELATNMLI